jgi:DNA-binding SARP family transcriptional activator
VNSVEFLVLGPRLVEALALWRGGAFEDFRYDGFAQGEIARLEEVRLVALENRVAGDLELGHQREEVGELRELTTKHPLRERLWGQLTVALYRSDQQADADPPECD